MTWPIQKLGNLAEKIDYGLTTSSTQESVGPKFLRITDIQNDRVDWNAVPFCLCSDSDKVKYGLRDGDIVFARTGATTGKSYLVTGCPPNVVFASYLIRVRPKMNILDPLFLSHYFRTPSYWRQIAGSSSGTAQPGVNGSKLSELKIPIPPLSEQKRIAAILDKADGLRRKRQEAIRLSEEFLRSVFLEMFGDPVANPKGWTVRSLNSLSEVQGGLQVQQSRREHDLQVPYLRVANIYRDRLVLDEIKYIGVTESELRRTSLSAGDVLIVEGHGNPDEIGRSAVWDGSIDLCVHQNHLIRVRVDSSVADPIYVSAFLNSSGGRRQMFAHGKTTSGLNTINLTNVKETEIPIPPIDIQNRYSKLVRKIMETGKRNLRFDSHIRIYTSSVVSALFNDSQ